MTNMTDLIAALPPKAVSMAVFFASVAFAVGSLELFRAWLERGAQDGKRRRADAIAAVLGLVFAAMIAGGIFGFATVGKAFIPLALFLTGAAGLGILIELIVRLHRGKLETDEMRRVLAQDL
jgi:hypothetical protein